MKNTYILFSLLVAFLFTSCKPETKEKNTNSLFGDKEPKVYAIFIDGTGSYKQLQKAKMTIAGIIRNAPEGTNIFIHWITEKSNSDVYSIISANIPENKVSDASYKNSKTRKTEQEQKKQVVSIKNQLIKQVMSAKSPNSSKTDIYGAIFAATERFENYKKQGILMMFTDLDDNVNNKFDNLNLNGADVMILDFQTDEMGKNKQFWNDKFVEFGAASVKFRHTDEIITYK